MIELEALQEMFANIADGAKWDMSKPMLWGYFFTDQSREKLVGAANLLASDGYSFVDIFVPDLEEGEAEYFFLHLEREEVHSAESLHERNLQLYAFAERHGLDTYDGMDVGPIVRST